MARTKTRHVPGSVRPVHYDSIDGTLSIALTHGEHSPATLTSDQSSDQSSSTSFSQPNSNPIMASTTDAPPTNTHNFSGPHCIPCGGPCRINKTSQFLTTIRTAICNDLNTKSWQPVLSGSLLNMLNIKCTELNLDGSDSDIRVTPIPDDTMATWLEKSKPSMHYKDGHTNRAGTGWSNAYHIHSCIKIYLYCPNWKRRSGGEPQLLSISNKIDYDIGRILQDENESLPHVATTLCQGVELVDGKLTVLELLTVVDLTDMRISDGAMEKNRLIPVTLTSIGNYNVRIIHGYVDPNGEMKLKVSRVMKFEKEEEYRGKNWNRVLCWALAEPV